jgi:hypothetical protein
MLQAFGQRGSNFRRGRCFDRQGSAARAESFGFPFIPIGYDPIGRAFKIRVRVKM